MPMPLVERERIRVKRTTSKRLRGIFAIGDIASMESLIFPATPMMAFQPCVAGQIIRQKI
jgi:thioredoxin reductase